MYVEHNKPNWDKLQAISILTSDSSKLGPALKKNPYIVLSTDYAIYNVAGKVKTNTCTY